MPLSSLVRTEELDVMELDRTELGRDALGPSPRREVTDEMEGVPEYRGRRGDRAGMMGAGLVGEESERA
jgi:hypothetical protein